MKRVKSVKQALRNILPASENCPPASSPASSDPVLPIKHLYAIGPQGSLIKYSGPPIALKPSPYAGGNLRYSTNGSLAYQSALTDLVRTAKMTLLFAEGFAPWNSSTLQAEVIYEADNGVECKLLPLLNVQSPQAPLDMGCGFLDMNTGKFSRELMLASATWGVNLAVIIRWQPGRRQKTKPLPPLPTADNIESTEARRRGSADSTGTIWPGPCAPRHGN